MNDQIGRREFLRQSSLAGIAATAAVSVDAGPASGAAAPPAHPPLPSDRQLDSREFSLSEYGRVRPSLGFEARDAAAGREWQGRARSKLTELVGGFPAERAPLRAEVLETRDMGSYTRERVVFQTRDNLSAIGYLLLPKQRAGALPAVVCLPGHGRGADDIVGIREDGSQRTQKEGYSKDFAIQAVERGYAAFALELLGFGARRDAAARGRRASESSCRPAAGAALLLGHTMVGLRVWDTMRAIDYLGTRPEVDPGRVATMGISGGGTISLFSAALDERVRCAVVSGYFNTFRDSIVSISHCMDNYVPGMLSHLEMYDLAGLVAPRALFVESGTRDDIFPLHGTRAALQRAREIYGVMGVPHRIGDEIFQGEHEFHGTGAFRFLAAQL